MPLSDGDRATTVTITDQAISGLLELVLPTACSGLPTVTARSGLPGVRGLATDATAVVRFNEASDAE